MVTFLPSFCLMFCAIFCVVIPEFTFVFDTALRYSEMRLWFVTRVVLCEDFLSLVFLFNLPLFPGFSLLIRLSVLLIYLGLEF